VVPLYRKKVEYKEHPNVGIYGFHTFDEKIVKFFKNLGIKPGSKIDIIIPGKVKGNNIF